MAYLLEVDLKKHANLDAATEATVREFEAAEHRAIIDYSYNDGNADKAFVLGESQDDLIEFVHNLMGITRLHNCKVAVRYQGKHDGKHMTMGADYFGQK